MSNKKVYWKGIEELANDPEFVKNRENEFAEALPVEEFLGNDKLANTSTNRRDFLKFLGFSVTAATLAACETPIKKAIPYVIKPEVITPGIPNFYASTYFDGNDYYSILVKTREGRPIKIEGNRLSKLTQGSTNARVQASVLSLYDNKRAKSAMKNGAPAPWAEVDTDITKKLAEISGAGKKIVILSSTINSPSTLSAIKAFGDKYVGTQHIQYDAVSYSAIREANQASFAKGVIPTYHFNKAHAIVSFGADFLNGWLMSGAYEKQYAETRRPENKDMSRHFQFESIMSMAGSNADYRTMIKQSEIGLAVVALYNYIASKSGKATVSAGKVAFEKDIAAAGDYLLAHKGHGLVVCGLNDVHAQLLVNEINSMINAYGNTIDLNAPVNIAQGNDKAVEQFIKDLNAKAVGAVILYNTNPAYTLPNGAEFNAALQNASLTVSFADRLEETAVSYLCPDHHYLESWNDFNPAKGFYGLQQPTIHPLFDTRSAQESLLVWAGLATRSDKNSTVYRDYVKTVWNNTIFPMSGRLMFEEFWNISLHDGIFEVNGNAPDLAAVSPVIQNPTPAVEPVTEAVAPAGISVDGAAKALAAIAAASKSWEVVMYQKVGIGTGAMANNPILQEFPDPITRITWDNYITMSPVDMQKPEFGFNQMMGQQQWSDVATVTVNGKTIDLPVAAQPGQAPGTIGIALGYGRKFGNKDEVVGKNAFPLVSFNGGYINTTAYNATVAPKGEKYQLAGTQTHHTMMGRDIIKETSLTEYQKNPRSGNPPKMIHTNLKEITVDGHQAPLDKVDYWQEFKMVNHRWGMSIDLSTCTGCGSCVVACHVENNVPVVGKDEVRRSRDMHWLRIDRYYSSDADPSTRYERGNDRHEEKEIASRNPKVAFQPVMCQHCNHAPCETVCPVLATTHSTEGLNQMTYNRCVGTRYCANNCPYKVRRFNWFQYSDNAKFDYYMNDDLGKMVLNPDVTVRARGVMEKCSMCVQRIQAGKLEAKKESRMVKDGEIETACSQACPTNAIIFGDFNDEQAQLTKWSKDPRAYYLLEEVGVKPNIVYQTKVRNVSELYGHKEPSHGAGHETHGAGHEHAEGHESHGSNH